MTERFILSKSVRQKPLSVKPSILTYPGIGKKSLNSLEGDIRSYLPNRQTNVGIDLKDLLLWHFIIKVAYHSGWFEPSSPWTIGRAALLKYAFSTCFWVVWHYGLTLGSIISQHFIYPLNTCQIRFFQIQQVLFLITSLIKFCFVEQYYQRHVFFVIVFSGNSVFSTYNDV